LRTAFQPIFRFEAGRLVPVACEALLRASNGETPVLTEAWFSSLTREQFRAIEPELRRLHIRSARHLPSSLRRLFLNFDPRIPESRTDFEHALRDLADELRAAGISSNDIVCEITEAETESAEALTHFAYELRARGYVIAVDDFGAHASRLARVAALAPDLVKFDGKLVKRLLSTRSGAATLATLTGQFRKDGIHSVFEGLEALWEIGAAESAGASMVQGFVVAAPRLAGPELAAWIAQYQPPPGGSDKQLVKRFR
jgi:EAL domain-containing protein (putative c-di-GMP-specific phosphodiesterase class I)